MSRFETIVVVAAFVASTSAWFGLLFNLEWYTIVRCFFGGVMAGIVIGFVNTFDKDNKP